MIDRAPIPTAREILSRIWSPPLSASIRFALVQRPASVNARVVGFAAVADLAAGIHRRRSGRALRLLDAALQFEGEPAPRLGVAVWAVDTVGDRTDYLGWAWLDGGQRRQLAAALEAAQPQQPAHSEAA